MMKAMGKKNAKGTSGSSFTRVQGEEGQPRRRQGGDSPGECLQGEGGLNIFIGAESPTKKST